MMACVRQYVIGLKKVIIDEDGNITFKEYWDTKGRHGIGSTLQEAKKNTHSHSLDEIPFVMIPQERKEVREEMGEQKIQLLFKKDGKAIMVLVDKSKNPRENKKTIEELKNIWKEAGFTYMPGPEEKKANKTNKK